MPFALKEHVNFQNSEDDMRPNAEIEFFQTAVQAPVQQVYRSFTRGVGLQEWLCNGARTVPQIGGMIALWWNKGYYMVGEFTRLEPNAFVSFTWHGRGEPQPSTVQIQLIEENGTTRVEVTHQGLGSEEIWVEPRKEIRLGWEQGLKNLVSVLETGKDLRVVNRPGMGIYPAELSLEKIAEHGFPVNKGIFLQQVIDGLGAEKAGLLKDDLVIEIGGTAVPSIESLLHFLGRQTMGDQVKVIYYRGAEKKTATLELKKLPIPEVPDTHQEFMSKLEEIFQNSLQFLKEAVESVSDEAASWKPAPEEWSIKETLAHIIHTERDNQFWLHAKILDEDFNWLDNTKERVVATVEAYPRVEELLYEINRAQKETLAFVKNMPDSLISRKTTFWHLAQGILTADSHTREHIDQIQQNLRAYASLQKP